MLFSRYGPLAVAAVATLCGASPMVHDVAVVRPRNELALRGKMDMMEHHLEKRLSFDFALDHSWKNQVLFAGSWIESQPDIGMTEGVSLAVKCIDCYTKGTVTAKLTTEDIVKPVVRLEFRGVEAYVDMEVAMSAGATYAVELFASNSPVGLGLPGLSLGLVFYVDLVFSLSAMLDLTGGFYVRVPDDAFLEVDVFDGDVTDHLFTGLSSKTLPVNVKTGNAVFKAALRLRVQCGAELEVPIVGAGATAELGIYANIIEFGAMIEKTPDCDLQTKEWFDLNVGAFARFGVIVDFKTIGAIPTVSTTLLAAETFTQCWLPNRSPMETGIGGMPVLTATTIAAPSVSVTISPPAVSVLPDTGSGSGGDSGINLSIITISVPAPLPPTPTAVAAPTITPPSFPLSNSSAPAAGTGGGVILTTGAPGSGDDLVTSTVFVTTTYTVTSCAASVINCPATYQKEIIVTATVSSFTTVCPATAVITDVPATTSVAPLPATTSASPEDKPDVQVVHVVSSVVVLVPCATPLAETFTPPAGVVAPTEHVVTGGPYQPTFVPAPVVVAAPSGLPAPPKKYKFDNGTVPSAPGAAKPSTVVPPAGPAPPKKFVETAGAPGSAAVASSFVAIVGAIAGSLLLL